MIYTEICIRGKLDPNWTDWLEDMQVLEEQYDGTKLCGNLPDKSAVYGVISRLSSLGITLISVNCREEANPGPAFG
jgi:hypothetical protein